MRLPYVVEHANHCKYWLSGEQVDESILNGLYGRYYKLYFPEELSDRNERLLVLDVGAHRGYYCATMCTMFPNSSVIAVEPDQLLAKGLRKNVDLNHLQKRVEIHVGALSNADGFGLLEKSDEGSWGNRLLPHMATQHADTKRVQTFRLESILNGRSPHIVKSNCEGGEFSLIPQIFALGIRPKLITLLVHPSEGSLDDLLAQISDGGYQVMPVESSLSHPRFVCINKLSS